MLFLVIFLVILVEFVVLGRSKLLFLKDGGVFSVFSDGEVFDILVFLIIFLIRGVI